jgi:hypothetical protein
LLRSHEITDDDDDVAQSTVHTYDVGADTLSLTSQSLRAPHSS